mgnify:CR=1 FL=1
MTLTGIKRLSDPLQLINSAVVATTAIAKDSQNVLKSKTILWKYKAIILIIKLESKKDPDPSTVFFVSIPKISIL